MLIFFCLVFASFPDIEISGLVSTNIFSITDYNGIYRAVPGLFRGGKPVYRQLTSATTSQCQYLYYTQCGQNRTVEYMITVLKGVYPSRTLSGWAIGDSWQNCLFYAIALESVSEPQLINSTFYVYNENYLQQLGGTVSLASSDYNTQPSFWIENDLLLFQAISDPYGHIANFSVVFGQWPYVNISILYYENVCFEKKTASAVWDRSILALTSGCSINSPCSAQSTSIYLQFTDGVWTGINLTISTFSAENFNVERVNSSSSVCPLTFQAYQNSTEGFRYSFSDVFLSQELLVGSLAFFQCLPSFDLIGSRSIQCLSNGSWSDSVPLCRKGRGIYVKPGDYYSSEDNVTFSDNSYSKNIFSMAAYWHLAFNFSSLPNYASLDSFGYGLIQAPLFYDPSNTGGCAPLNSSFAGKILLVVSGSCSFDIVMQNAQDSDVAAVVFIQPIPAYPY